MSAQTIKLKKLSKTLTKIQRSLPNKARIVVGLIILTLAVVLAFQPQTDQPGSPSSDDQQVIPSTNPNQLYQVDRVIDGDTIRIFINQESHPIRLIGVDTPESVDPRRPVQCFGQEASRFTRQHLEGQYVYIESDPTQKNADTYNRLLRYVKLQDGRDFNAVLISEGFAHEYTFRIPYLRQSQYQQLELKAQNERRGLWHPDNCPSP